MSIIYVYHKYCTRLDFISTRGTYTSDNHNIPHKYVQVKMMSYFYYNYTDLL